MAVMITLKWTRVRTHSRTFHVGKDARILKINITVWRLAARPSSPCLASLTSPIKCHQTYRLPLLVRIFWWKGFWGMRATQVQIREMLFKSRLWRPHAKYKKAKEFSLISALIMVIKNTLIRLNLKINLNYSQISSNNWLSSCRRHRMASACQTVTSKTMSSPFKLKLIDLNLASSTLLLPKRKSKQST